MLLTCVVEGMQHLLLLHCCYHVQGAQGGTGVGTGCCQEHLRHAVSIRVWHPKGSTENCAVCLPAHTTLHLGKQTVSLLQTQDSYVTYRH